MAYNGGKAQAGVYQALINMMPPHRVYIEAFLGAGAIMRMKRPAAVNVGIEIDNLVASSFLASADPISREITIINGDAVPELRKMPLAGDELVYCDPPYLMATRSSSRALYRHEMSDDQHAELLRTIRTLPCMVMISGYWSELYAELLAGWRLESYNAVKRNGAVAKEFVWCNFPRPLELHDYRYLGSNFRERERIKRRKSRWVERLQVMRPEERYAILAAIDEARGTMRPNGR